MIKSVLFLNFIIVLLFKASTVQASMIDRCKVWLGSLGRGHQNTTEGMATQLAERQAEIQKLTGNKPLPFGNEVALSNDQYREVLKKAGGSWEDLNRIERALSGGEELKPSDKKTLARLVQDASKEFKGRERNDPETLSARGLFIKAVQGLLDKQHQRENQKSGGQGGSGKSEGGGASQNQKSGEGRESGGNASSQQQQGEEKQTAGQGPQKADGKQGAGQTDGEQAQGVDADKKQGAEQRAAEGADGEKREGGSAADFVKEFRKPLEDTERGQTGANDPQRDPRDDRKNARETRKPPKSDYRTEKGLSEVILRHLYVWELRKFHSAVALQTGLQNYFNFLQTAAGIFHKAPLAHYTRVVEGFLRYASSDEFRFFGLSEVHHKISDAIAKGDLDTAYRIACHIYRVVNEIQLHATLKPEEAELLQAAEKLITSLRSGGDNTDAATARRFYYDLPGPLSRKILENEYGAGLLERGTLAQKEFAAAIKKGRLKTYRLMSLLRPLLNIRHHQLYTRVPLKGYGHETNVLAKGPQTVRNTGDIGLMDQFVELESREDLMENLIHSRQPYHTRRVVIQRPVFRAKALHKISRILADESGSMSHARAYFRNMLVAAYVDHHLAELISPAEVARGTKKDTGSHTIYYVPFNSEVQGEVEMRTQATATQFVEGLNARPKSNLGGTTEIEKALVSELEKLLQAKQENSQLAFASILLLTDGEESPVGEAVIETYREKFRRAYGEQMEVLINVVAIGKEQTSLKRIALNSARQRDSADSVQETTYKFVSDAEIREYISEAKSQIPLDELERAVSWDSHTFWTASQIGTRIRQTASEFTQKTNVANSKASRKQTHELLMRHLEEVFSKHGSVSDGPYQWVQATEQILNVVEKAINTTPKDYVPVEARATFLWDLLQDLCQDQDLRWDYFKSAVLGPKFITYRIVIMNWLKDTKEKSK